MKTNTPTYKRHFFIGILLVALGVIFSTTLKELAGSPGVVFIALGVLFMVSGMHKKREYENKP